MLARCTLQTVKGSQDPLLYRNENDGWKSWPYDHPFHLVVNLAVGGMWGRAGGGIDDTIFPQRLLVDYVRVYRLPESDADEASPDATLIPQ
jgi:hypothetical protein